MVIWLCSLNYCFSFDGLWTYLDHIVAVVTNYCSRSCISCSGQYLQKFLATLNNIFMESKTRRGSLTGSFTWCNIILYMFYFSNCGMRDPSWAELRHFVNFLNSQLQSCEESTFCNMEHVGDTLEGFRRFVVNFMILMSRVGFFCNVYCGSFD